MSHSLHLVGTCAVALALAACAHHAGHGPAPASEAGAAGATAALEARSGSTAHGTATLTATPAGVQVVVTIEGATPGLHGAHIHEKGDCSAPDASSAGSHFAPGAHPHALPPTGPRHLGDLGNIEVGAEGSGRLEFLVEGANLQAGDAHSFLGRSVIVHEKADDGGQPTGNAGGRIVCGVIEAAR